MCFETSLTRGVRGARPRPREVRPKRAERLKEMLEAKMLASPLMIAAMVVPLYAGLGPRGARGSSEGRRFFMEFHFPTSLPSIVIRNSSIFSVFKVGPKPMTPFNHMAKD